MKKSSSYLIALVFSAAIISETHCFFDEHECREDFGICSEDSVCCSKLCIIKPGENNIGRCYGYPSDELIIDPPSNLIKSIGHLCELKGITTDNDEVFERDMYKKYGPLNVAFDFYPTNTTVELTINNITRFVVVNEHHNKTDLSPVLKLSPTAAREFLVSFIGLVPCEFHIPPTPYYYTYKFWLYTGFISTMVLSPIVLALIY